MLYSNILMMRRMLIEMTVLIIMIKDKVIIKVEKNILKTFNSQLIAATHWGYDARKIAIFFIIL